MEALSLSELNPIIFNIELTYLGSEAAIYILNVRDKERDFATKIIMFYIFSKSMCYFSEKKDTLCLYEELLFFL